MKDVSTGTIYFGISFIKECRIQIQNLYLGIKVSRTSSSFDVTYCPTRFSKVVYLVSSCVLYHPLHCKYIDCQKHNFLWFNISHALPVPFGHQITGSSTADKWYFHFYFWKYFLYHTDCSSYT